LFALITFFFFEEKQPAAACGHCGDQQKQLEHQQQEVKREESPLENEPNPRAKKLEKKLQKAQVKVCKWMAGIEPTETGPTTDKLDYCALEEEEEEDEEEKEEDEDSDEEEEEDEDEAEAEDEEVDNEEESQDEPIEEGGGGGDEDDDKIVIEDVMDIGEVQQQQQEVKGESSMEITETPFENEATSKEATPNEPTPRVEIPREETLQALEERLAIAVAKVYKWMAGIEPNQIGPTLGAWDNSYILKMIEVADQEIREHPEKFIY
jgi:hypothetical protein